MGTGGEGVTASTGVSRTAQGYGEDAWFSSTCPRKTDKLKRPQDLFEAESKELKV